MPICLFSLTTALCPGECQATSGPIPAIAGTASTSKEYRSAACRSPRPCPALVKASSAPPSCPGALPARLPGAGGRVAARHSGLLTLHRGGQPLPSQHGDCRARGSPAEHRRHPLPGTGAAQLRPPEPALAVFCMDAKQIEVRTGKRMAKAATYTCVGIDLEGRKRVLTCLSDLWRQCRDPVPLLRGAALPGHESLLRGLARSAASLPSPPDPSSAAPVIPRQETFTTFLTSTATASTPTGCTPGMHVSQSRPRRP